MQLLSYYWISIFGARYSFASINSNDCTEQTESTIRLEVSVSIYTPVPYQIHHFPEIITLNYLCFVFFPLLLLSQLLQKSSVLPTWHRLNRCCLPYCSNIYYVHVSNPPKFKMGWKQLHVFSGRSSLLFEVLSTVHSSNSCTEPQPWWPSLT